MQPSRNDWQRFVLIKVDARDGMSMYPRLLPGATVLIDRHYNSLAPYRGQQRTLYAVRHGAGAGAGLRLRFVEYDDDRLVLRPLSLDFPVELVPLRPKESPGDYIVGRICLVFSEL